MSDSSPTSILTEHSIKSRAVDQTFRIKVLQPARSTDCADRLPVLYVTDSDEFFAGLATISTILQKYGEARPFILAGIGYDNPSVAGLLRTRDLFTHAIRSLFDEKIQQIAGWPLMRAADNVNTITQTTDAGAFLSFIRDELMPYVDLNYATISGENTYYGYSAGGTFGLYTIFTQPDTFQRYILGSPATSYNGHHYGIDLASTFLKKGGALNANIFISVGEMEELETRLSGYEFVSAVYRLANFVKQKSIPGLALTLRMFPGETHATAWSSAFTHGVKTLLAPK